jgi:hypothetical protein
LDKLCRSCHGNKKGGIKNNFGFLSSNFMNFVGISTVVCVSFWGLKKFKMAAIAMVTKVADVTPPHYFGT